MTLDADADESLDAPLPTFATLARFRESAATEDEAVASVNRSIVDAGVSCDGVSLERRDDDGSWLVTARIVTVSIDAHTAVGGVVADLEAAGLAPDEVWVQRQLA